MWACPHCRAEHKDDPRNRPGAVDLCIVCGEWIVFSQDGVRLPGTAENKNIAASVPLQRMRGAWEAMQRQIGNQSGGPGFTFED